MSLALDPHSLVEGLNVFTYLITQTFIHFFTQSTNICHTDPIFQNLCSAFRMEKGPRGSQPGRDRGTHRLVCVLLGSGQTQEFPEDREEEEEHQER